MLRWKQTKPVGSKKTKKSFTWSLQTFTLRDILNRFKLPCVVKCCYESCPIQWSSFNIDLSQPLLIHSNRTVGKLVGKCVRNEHASLADTGSDATVVIPVDYDGKLESKTILPLDNYILSSQGIYSSHFHIIRYANRNLD